MDTKKGEIMIKRPYGDEAPKMFTFDAVFDETKSQEDLFIDGALPIVENVLEGYNGTVFAYG